MEKKKIFILVLIVLLVIAMLIIFTAKRDQYRIHEVENFEHFYVPKKIKECLSKHGYSVDSPSTKEEKECKDYVMRIWDEQKVLNSAAK